MLGDDALYAIRKDVEALIAARARTTEGEWYPGQTQDGEYTGPGDNPSGYAGDWERDGSVWAGADEEPENLNVFERGINNANHVADVDWVVLAHNVPIEQHCRDLLDEVERLKGVIALLRSALPIP